MENEGALNTFEVPHIFYQICESFIAPSDNGAGKCMEENANVKKTVSAWCSYDLIYEMKINKYNSCIIGAGTVPETKQMARFHFDIF
jgi:hypothetical protein